MEKDKLETSGNKDDKKKPKTYKKLVICLVMILMMNECVGCYSCSSSRWGIYNGVEERIANSVDETIVDAMTGKKSIDGVKVDETRTLKTDTIGLYRKGKKWGFYNMNTDKIIVVSSAQKSTEYDNAWFFAEGLAAVELDGKIGFVDTKGQLLIPYQFLCRTNGNRPIGFQYGYCKMAGCDGRFGVIDKKGRWVVSPIYEDLNLTTSCVYASTSTSRIQLNYQGDVMQRDMVVKIEPLKCSEDSTSYFVYYVHEGDDSSRCGIMDASGRRLTEPIYSRVIALVRGFFGCYLLDEKTMEVKRL